MKSTFAPANRCSSTVVHSTTTTIQRVIHTYPS